MLQLKKLEVVAFWYPTLVTCLMLFMHQSLKYDTVIFLSNPVFSHESIRSDRQIVYSLVYQCEFYMYGFCTKKIRPLCLSVLYVFVRKNPVLMPVLCMFLYEKNPALMPICFVRFCTTKSGAYACVMYVLCTKKFRPTYR